MAARGREALQRHQRHQLAKVEVLQKPGHSTRDGGLGRNTGDGPAAPALECRLDRGRSLVHQRLLHRLAAGLHQQVGYQGAGLAVDGFPLGRRDRSHRCNVGVERQGRERPAQGNLAACRRGRVDQALRQPFRISGGPRRHRPCRRRAQQGKQQSCPTHGAPSLAMALLDRGKTRRVQVTATGYDPRILTWAAKSPSSASASASGDSCTWTLMSMKNAYCHLPVCAGRDSIRFMLMPCRASGSSTWNSAPGWSRTNTSSEVRSLPDGGNSARPSTRKRVVLSMRSSIGPATICSPYTCAALSPAIAAASSALRARRAASALLDTACHSTFGRFWRSQPRHCASDCGCDITRSISSRWPPRDSRY